MSRVELHIEELVLHGFPAGDHERIAAAVAGEVARRLGGAEERLADLAAGPPIERIDAGALRIADAARPTEIGAQIGAAVAGAVSGPPAGGKP